MIFFNQATNTAEARTRRNTSRLSRVVGCSGPLRIMTHLIAIAAFVMGGTQATAQTGQWTLKSPATSPGARAAQAMAFDSVRRETVVFGGYGGPGGYWGDTWAWDGTNWTLKATTGPSPRANVSMSFDSARGVIVLFGGFFGGSLGETWEWNGTMWTQRFPAGPVPPARNDYGMAFDSVRNVTVLFAGGGASGQLSDTWEWNGTAWTQRAEVIGYAGDGATMAFDSRRGVCVYFGGPGMTNTYEFNGVSWALRATTGISPRRYAPMAYDPVRGVTVLTGGNNFGPSASGTFEWNGLAWTQLNVGGPGAWQGHKLAFDTSRNEMVQFGGTFSGAGTSQTWVLQTLQPVFTDWTAFNSSQAVGVLNGSTVTLSSSAQDPFLGSVVDGTSTIFNDAALFRPALPRSDIMFIRANPAGVTYTINFGQPVTNPVLHLQSLAATLTFAGVSPVKVSGQSTFTVSGNQVIGSFLGPPPSPNNDANGTVRLPGTFTSVSFTAQWASGVDGIGLQIGLGVSVPLAAAGPTDNATVSSTRPDPGAGSTTTFTVNTFTIESGSSWTLGSGEILNAPGGLVVQPGAVLIANGTINGPLVNNGLTIIPITQASLISRVVPGPSRGVIIIPVPRPTPGVPPTPIPVPLPNPPVIEPGEIIVISGSGPGAGPSGGGGGGGGSPGGGGTVRLITPSLPIQGTIRLDSLLEVTGPVTQSVTGITRLFIAGNTRGQTYSAMDSGQTISLDGGIQVVLRPEMFGYTPSIGDTFDVMYAPGGITLPDGSIELSTFLTPSGASALGLTLPPYLSPFPADPDTLVQFPSSLFSYSIVNGGTTLRLTMVSPACGPVNGPGLAAICPAESAQFSVSPLGSGPFNYRWQVENPVAPGQWLNLSDGLMPGLGTFSGTSGATLTVSLVARASSNYRCVVDSPCTQVTSSIATLIVQTTCSPADLADSDGLTTLDGRCPDGTIDNGDFTAFFFAFFADVADPFRAAADIANTDGETTLDGVGPDGVVDNGDFTAFFALFFQGCPN